MKKEDDHLDFTSLLGKWKRKKKPKKLDWINVSILFMNIFFWFLILIVSWALIITVTEKF